MPKGDKLSLRQERFIGAFLREGNATQAAIEAGYSAKTAAQGAGQLFRNIKVSTEIARRRAKLAQKLEISAERIVAELAKIGFANMQDFTRLVGEDRVVDLSAATRDQLAAVGEITIEDFKDGRGEEARDVRRVKFKLLDKRAALVDLGKHLGMFIERSEVGRPGDFAKLSDAELREKLIGELIAAGRTEAEAAELAALVGPEVEDGTVH